MAVKNLRSATSEAHRRQVEFTIADIARFLQETLGQKLVADGINSEGVCQLPTDRLRDAGKIERAEAVIKEGKQTVRPRPLDELVPLRARFQPADSQLRYLSRKAPASK